MKLQGPVDLRGNWRHQAPYGMSEVGGSGLVVALIHHANVSTYPRSPELEIWPRQGCLKRDHNFPCKFVNNLNLS